MQVVGVGIHVDCGRVAQTAELPRRSGVFSGAMTRGQLLALSLLLAAVVVSSGWAWCIP